MVYTGYFSQIDNYLRFNSSLQLVSISLYTQNWIKQNYCIELYDKLMPEKDVLLQYKSTEHISDFIENFGKQLSRLNVDEVYGELDNKIILCYERPEDFCHRQLVKLWFISNGYECKEIKL